MEKLEAQILAAVARKNYQPLKPKALARKLGVTSPEYARFCRVLKDLRGQGRLDIGTEIFIPEDAVGDAVTGDTVLVRIKRRPGRPHLGPSGAIVQVIERATHQ